MRHMQVHKVKSHKMLSGFTLLRAFLSAQKSAQGPAQPL